MLTKEGKTHLRNDGSIKCFCLEQTKDKKEESLHIFGACECIFISKYLNFAFNDNYKANV